jgi:molybdopterin/thiamine biosynthesis adenylyltransferase/rhodanese-related sulfurtransferase
MSTRIAEPAAAHAAALSPEESRHYSRHLILPEVGIEGQLRLKRARVLLIGAGGLGSPLSMYLAAAGVGTLGLVDFDVVDETNLHRQVLYGHDDIGRPKLAAAVERLSGINPHIDVVPHPTRLTAANALDLFAAYDIVADGSDNFATRYLVNDACVLSGKPAVYGSVARFEGQVSVFWGARGPCYRCLFPEPPPPGLVPSCAEGGVLGVLPGVIGALQANEVVKLIVGIGEPLIGRLLLFDALKLKFREIRLRKDPACPVCPERPTQAHLIDYEQFCGVGAVEPQENTMTEPSELPFDIAPVEAKELLAHPSDVVVLDVRTAQEHAVCSVPGSVLIPLQELAQRLGELDPAQRYVVHCHHGGRSARAVAFMRHAGYEGAQNLAGGIEAWSLEVDPSVPRY